jgi:hypothetical protein
MLNGTCWISRGVDGPGPSESTTDDVPLKKLNISDLA